jgi:hypothetical protein
MGMNMKNGLPGIGVGVEDNPIPRLEHPLELGNPPSSQSNPGKQPRITSRQLPQVPIPSLGHDKHMNLRLRPNIPKGKGGIVLIDNISRDLTSNDPLEESLILTHGNTLATRNRPPSPAPSEGAGGPGGTPGWGSGGLTPRRHNEREAATEASEARGGGRGAVDPGGRSTATAAAAGPRGEVPGGVCAFPVARRDRKRCVAR